MQKQFKKNINALDEVFDFVDSFLSKAHVDDSVAFSTRLTIEELFTNLVKYNSGGLDYIRISLDQDTDRLILKLMDYNVEPFDAREIEPLDTRQPLEKRKVGKLGLHIVRRAVDDLKYEYSDGTMCITAIINLEEKNV